VFSHARCRRHSWSVPYVPVLQAVPAPTPAIVDSRIPIGIAAGLAPVRGRGDRLNIRRFALSSGQTNGIRLLEVLETRGRAPHPDWHVAEQRAECRVVMSLAGQAAPTSDACAAILAGNRHLCRHDLRLDRGGQPFCLPETKPEVGHACLLVALKMGDLDLRRLPVSNSATNFTRHTSFGTSSPSTRELRIYRSRNKPHKFAWSLSGFGSAAGDVHWRDRDMINHRRRQSRPGEGSVG
jgi:hypothetical protein